jgi:serine/threonine protein kinase
MADDDPTRQVDPDDKSTRRADPDDFATVRGLSVGRKVFGRYVLEAKLGAGGMGVVWRARDVELEEQVALKFLPEVVARDEAAVSELKIETRHARRLTHPNIVRIHQFEREGAMAAVSMEFVDGMTLTKLRLAQPGEVFAVEALAPLVAQLCAALDYAHAQAKIVHRDLKPANILVTRDSAVKVADFGIARSLSDTHTRLTGRAGDTSGTLVYMSPQQLRGADPAASDDIYALGATLYELLTGKPPFNTGDIGLQIREIAPKRLNQRRTALGLPPVPSEWEDTILACLAKEPENRPQSASEVARRLNLAANSTDEKRGKVVAPRAPSSQFQNRRSKLLLLVAGVVAVALGVAIYVFSLRWDRRAERVSTDSANERQIRGNLPIHSPESVVLPREFTVTVDPPDAGARLWLGPLSDFELKDGKVMVNNLPDGEQELVVQAPGYQTFTTRVMVKNGRGSADAKLVAVKGVVEITARPGTVVTAVDPRGRMTLVGTVPATGVFMVDKLLPIDAYTFRLAHRDCAPAEAKDVGLTAGRIAKVAPLQLPLPGELRVFSVPTGAEASVNGKDVGSTPATVAAQPSETPLVVELFLRGYRRAAQTVKLKPKETRILNFGALAAENGAIRPRLLVRDRSVDLTGVEYAVDGRQVTLSGDVLAGLAVGEHKLEAIHPNYATAFSMVAVKDQQTTPADLTFVPKPAVLAFVVNGPSDYTVRAGGRPVAVEGGHVLLPAGEELAIEVAAKGFRSGHRTLTLPANGTEKLVLTLEKASGTIRPRTTVRGQYIEILGVKYSIDGREMTLANGVIAGLAVGNYNLEAKHPDYETAYCTASVKDQETSLADVALVPKPAILTLNVTGTSGYTLRAMGQSVAVSDDRAMLPAAEELKLEVSAKGYKTATRMLTLQPNGEQRWDVAMERESRNILDVLPNDPQLRYFAPVTRVFKKDYKMVWNAALQESTRRSLFTLFLPERGTFDEKEGWIYSAVVGGVTGMGPIPSQGWVGNDAFHTVSSVREQQQVVLVTDLGTGVEVQVITKLYIATGRPDGNGGYQTEEKFDSPTEDEYSGIGSTNLSAAFLDKVGKRLE